MSYWLLKTYAKSSVACLILVSLCASFFPAVSFAATPIVFSTLSIEKTGSEPFNTSTTNDDCTLGDSFDSSRTFSNGQSIKDWDSWSWNEGRDACSDNDVVRLWDSITYRVEVSLNDSNVDELFSTVTLEPYNQTSALPDASWTIHQEWIEIPSSCQTDPEIVITPSQLQDLDNDGSYETLFCNLWSAREGTNKVFFPTSRVLSTSSDGLVPTLNDSIVWARSSSYAVSNTPSTGNNGTSSLAITDSVESLVTANFAVNLTKVPKDEEFDTNGDPISASFIEALWPNGEDGYLWFFLIQANYQKGSMLANSNEMVDHDSDGYVFEQDYDLIDFYTDDNTNNDGAFSSNMQLYTWDSSVEACEL